MKYALRLCGNNLYIFAALVVLAFAGTARGHEQAIVTPGMAVQDALDMQLYGCIANERAQWSTIGTAALAGEAWVYSWTVSQEWNDDQGEYVQILPITHNLTVPGERLEVIFEDGSKFTYGEPLNGTNHHIWGDNLYSIANHSMVGMPAPYTAVKRNDGAIYLLKVVDDGTCSVGWYLGDINQ